MNRTETIDRAYQLGLEDAAEHSGPRDTEDLADALGLTRTVYGVRQMLAPWGNTTGQDVTRAYAEGHAWLGGYLGRRCRIGGGFEDGLTGLIVANEPTAERPWRYRVELDGTDGRTIGGLHPVNLDLEECRYCGIGPCHGPLTANGRDLERHDAIHAPAREAVAVWRERQRARA